jgi:hypothetical protein
MEKEEQSIVKSVLNFAVSQNKLVLAKLLATSEKLRHKSNFRIPEKDSST